MKYIVSAVLLAMLASCGSNMGSELNELKERSLNMTSNLMNIDDLPKSTDLNAGKEVCAKSGVSGATMDKCAKEQAEFAASVL